MLDANQRKFHQEASVPELLVATKVRKEHVDRICDVGVHFQISLHKCTSVGTCRLWGYKYAQKLC
jgi:hypothetical protein